jgi:hypothetical protein
MSLQPHNADTVIYDPVGGLPSSTTCTSKERDPMQKPFQPAHAERKDALQISETSDLTGRSNDKSNQLEGKFNRLETYVKQLKERRNGTVAERAK